MFFSFLFKILKKLCGTTADELFWRWRHIKKKKWPHSYLSEDSLTSGHRSFLIQHISTFSPFFNLLEVGCASAPNLFLLSQKFPSAKFYGVDISNSSLDIGRQWLAKHNVDNVELLYGRADHLTMFEDKSVDVVFTFAVLLYIGPDKIESVINELFRIARKGIVCIEWNSTQHSLLIEDHWAHDWEYLASRFSPSSFQLIALSDVEGQPLSNVWRTHGRLIKISL